LVNSSTGTYSGLINSSTGTFSGSIGTARSLTAGTIQTLTASTLTGTLTGGTYTGVITGSLGTSCNFTAGTINILTSSSNASIAGLTIGSGTSGIQNTGVGFFTLGSNTGEGNSAFGHVTLRNNTSGSLNTSVGAFAGCFIDTGSFNTSIGYNAGGNITTGTFNTSIGYAAQPSAANTTGQFTLGDSNVGNLRCADTTISALSDKRDKANIQDIPVGLDYVKELRPVMFDWEARDGSRRGKKDFGFIAQELYEVQNKFGYSEHTRLVHKDNPDAWEADPMKTYPILIKAVQQLSAKVDSLEAQLASK
jgi:hypothetical protein